MSLVLKAPRKTKQWDGTELTEQEEGSYFLWSGQDTAIFQETCIMRSEGRNILRIEDRRSMTLRQEYA